MDAQCKLLVTSSLLLVGIVFVFECRFETVTNSANIDEFRKKSRLDFSRLEGALTSFVFIINASFNHLKSLNPMVINFDTF